MRDRERVKNRWDRIRQNPKCDLALTPEAVSKYLGRKESELVRDRIQESLTQLAQYRLDKERFVSEDPPGHGDLAACEGLEAFLVPAVEGALPLSAFLKSLKPDVKDRFLAAMRGDIGKLVDNWKKSQFSGEPYAREAAIRGAVIPKLQDKFKKPNITEAAAVACRVLIHVLTLKLNPSESEESSAEFIDLTPTDLLPALKNAVDFLVNAFQKGDGETDDEKIANAKVGGESGSGWSWTDHPGLPPILFFTSSVVDAFAELDLYLIRQANEWKREGNDDQRLLLNFYTQNEATLLRLQQCVEMARVWIQNAVLPDLSFGNGQHVETKVRALERPEEYSLYESDLKRQKLEHPPMIFYNNLYGLQILLWSWADWDEEGLQVDEDTKSKINRALAQLVYNYDSVLVIKEVLNKFPYQFYLPGEGLFRPGVEKGTEYLDSGFLPLLTRLLVLFVVYGVGDRNLLEPAIRNLYVELMQNRNRTQREYGALWSADKIEVFSTQRAIQALSFYYAYARGREAVEPRTAAEDIILLRNPEHIPLVLEAKLLSPVTAPQLAAAIETISEESFSDYCKKVIPGWALPAGDEKSDEFIRKVMTRAKVIFTEIKAQPIQDPLAARLILNSLARLAKNPSKENVLREPEFMLLEEMYQDLKKSSASR